MWLFLSSILFPPPTEAWLQTVSSDPEAQGWGACAKTEKTPLRPRGTESDEEAEENKDAGFLLSLLEPENLTQGTEPNQELEAFKLKLWAMEHTEALLEPPCVLDNVTEEEGAGAKQLLSPETMGCFFPQTPKEKVEADQRSVYVGNVDYGGSATELEAYLSPCGEIHRVTILCNKFSGHPKGYTYIEFTSQSSAQAAMDLFETVFRGRVIKVLPKRTNFPGIGSTDHGELQTNLRSRAYPFLHSSLQHRSRFRSHGQNWGPWMILTMVLTLLKRWPTFQ